MKTLQCPRQFPHPAHMWVAPDGTWQCEGGPSPLALDELDRRADVIAGWLAAPLSPEAGRTWAEDAVADPADLAAYLSVHPEQLRRFVDSAIQAHADSSTCRQHDHAGRLDYLERVVQERRWSMARDATPHVEAPLDGAARLEAAIERVFG